MSDYGFILVNKPAGISSFQIIKVLRKITGIRKIGHTGTLDPFASGLVPVCIGKATRLSDLLLTNSKTYIAEMHLGYKTDTGDIEGSKIEERETPKISADLLNKAVRSILELKEQIPPPYSAIKKDGKRAYSLARAGIKVDLPPRPVQVLNFHLIEYNHPHLVYKTTVSKGTYIRVLSETFAAYLDTIAVTTTLLRTNIGKLQIEDAVDLNKINAANWKSFLLPPAAVIDLPQLVLNESHQNDFYHGRKIKLKENSVQKYLLIDKNNKSLGIGVINSEGWLQPKVVLK